MRLAEKRESFFFVHHGEKSGESKEWETETYRAFTVTCRGRALHSTEEIAVAVTATGRLEAETVREASVVVARADRR